MKKLVSLLVVAIMILAVFSGCSAQQPAATEPAAADSAAATEAPAAPAEPAVPKTIHEETWDEIVAAAKTQSLVFYCWWGEELWLEMAKGFKDKYGIDVTITIGDGAVGVDKLIAEKDLEKSSIDLFAVGGGQVLTSLAADVYEENVLGLLPEADKLDPSLSKTQEGLITDGKLIPLYLNQTGFIYNPEFVKDPPQTWDELNAWIDANPKRFGICTADSGGSGESFFQAAMNHLTGGLDQYAGDMEADPAKVAKWDSIWQWYNDRADKIVLTKGNSDSAGRLNSGEIWLTVLWSDDTYIAMSKGELNKNFVFYIPEIGCAGGGDTCGIVKNSANKELALLFASYLVSEEGQAKMAELGNVIPSNTTVVVTNTVIKNEEMVNRVAWVPACYKVAFKTMFLEKVLQ